MNGTVNRLPQAGVTTGSATNTPVPTTRYLPDTTPPLPAGPFDLILADPPWSWEAWSEAGEAKSSKRKYPVLTAEQIGALPVWKVAAPRCVLLLWTTWPMLPQAIEVMASWGLPYKSGLPWVKRRPDGSPKMIMGYYWRHCSELLLVGKRGTLPPRLDKGVVGLLDTVAPREHSRKPDEAYDLIDRLFGTDLRRLEMFARPPHREGWAVWGDQAGVAA